MWNPLVFGGDSGFTPFPKVWKIKPACPESTVYVSELHSIITGRTNSIPIAIILILAFSFCVGIFMIFCLIASLTSSNYPFES